MNKPERLMIRPFTHIIRWVRYVTIFTSSPETYDSVSIVQRTADVFLFKFRKRSNQKN